MNWAGQESHQISIDFGKGLERAVTPFDRLSNQAIRLLKGCRGAGQSGNIAYVAYQSIAQVHHLLDIAFTHGLGFVATATPSAQEHDTEKKEQYPARYAL